jgi:hypothetical protein
MMCRHCQGHKANRPRGLCWSCYYTPGVRERYPSTSKYAHRGPDDFNGEAAPPAFPTRALPGSLEKILVLQQRVLSRQSLWHRDDGPVDHENHHAGVA